VTKVGMKCAFCLYNSVKDYKYCEKANAMLFFFAEMPEEIGNSPTSQLQADEFADKNSG